MRTLSRWTTLNIVSLSADESTTMLDSDSRYLPVLSGSSSPLVHRESKHVATDTTRPRRVVANFASQSAAVKHSDVTLQPTQSASEPTARSTSVHHHSQSPAAHTLHLDSSDVLDAAVGDHVDSVSSRDSGLCPPTDVQQKQSHELSDKNGVVSASLLDTVPHYSDDSELTCTTGNALLSAKNDRPLYHTADIVNQSDNSVQGKSTFHMLSAFWDDVAAECGISWNFTKHAA